MNIITFFWLLKRKFDVPKNYIFGVTKRKNVVQFLLLLCNLDLLQFENYMIKIIAFVVIKPDEHKNTLMKNIELG